MYQIKAYLKFLLKAKNQHGVHSPFIYDFVIKCIYDKTKFEEYNQILAYRRSLIKSKKSILVTDYGSGSKVFKTNKRKVSDIAQNSGTPLKKAKLLFRMVKYFQINSTLELGTSLGIATQAMSLGNSENKILSIEGCPNTAEFARNELKVFNISNVEVETGIFKELIPKIDTSNFDLIYFDGHHEKEATISYFDSLLNKAHNNSIFVFDDIYWSQEMTEAWEYIKEHKSVTVTVDIFHFGFVFFRKEQAKEHFKIRL